MKSLWSCLVLAMLHVCAVAGPTALTPRAVNREIQLHGAKETVRKIWDSKPHGAQWELLEQRIGTGDPRWLAVARRLRIGTDAGATEGLHISLANALPRNPRGVLQLAGSDDFPIKDVCGVPFIEPDAAFVKHYIAQTRRSLNRLKDEQLEQKRTDCLAEIEKAANYVASAPR